jgi:hypothetical protein
MDQIAEKLEKLPKADKNAVDIICKHMYCSNSQPFTSLFKLSDCHTILYLRNFGAKTLIS